MDSVTELPGRQTSQRVSAPITIRQQVWLVSSYALFVFVPQNDLLPITVLFVFRVDATQLKVS